MTLPKFVHKIMYLWITATRAFPYGSHTVLGGKGAGPVPPAVLGGKQIGDEGPGLVKGYACFFGRNAILS